MGKVDIANGKVKIDDTTGFFYPVQYRDEYTAGEWVDASGAAAPDIVNVTIGGVSTRMKILIAILLLSTYVNAQTIDVGGNINIPSGAEVKINGFYISIKRR